MGAMKVLQTHYDGTDLVSDAIERIVQYLAVNNSINTNNKSDYGDRTSSNIQNGNITSAGYRSGQPVTEWGDVLMRLPYCHLRVVVTLDLAVSKGEYPEESDFPSCLRTSLPNWTEVFRTWTTSSSRSIYPDLTMLS
jgi:hypothetical protein